MGRGGMNTEVVEEMYLSGYRSMFLCGVKFGVGRKNWGICMHGWSYYRKMGGKSIL